MRSDEREVDSIIKLGESNARKKDVDPLYEFQKKNRSKVRHAVDGKTETRDVIIREQFMLHYRAELDKVLDKLISDISDITNYLQ